jgi:hypothetical protein
VLALRALSAGFASSLTRSAADKNVKIADFGLSNMMKDGQFLRTSCGSPNYAAPEGTARRSSPLCARRALTRARPAVISGSAYAGPEIDVWSLGVILYAILCGSLPFDDDNVRNLFAKIKKGRFVLPSSLSEEARDLIQRMLRVDPISRIRISDIRKHPWFQRNLPRYLQYAPEQHAFMQQKIDEAVLEEACRLGGWTREDVLKAIASAKTEDLLTDKRMAVRLNERYATRARAPPTVAPVHLTTAAPTQTNGRHVLPACGQQAQAAAMAHFRRRARPQHLLASAQRPHILAAVARS